MEIQGGSIVYSKAGHDRGGMFLVLCTDGEYAFLADGKVRKLDKPKKKKQKHLQKTNLCIALDENVQTDAGIRKALAQLREFK